MSLEHSPTRTVDGAGPAAGAVGVSATDDVDYWHALIDEKAAGAFLKLTARSMQAMRQRGDGPRYVVISSRCLRYRRIGLRAWADARVSRIFGGTSEIMKELIGRTL